MIIFCISRIVAKKLKILNAIYSHNIGGVSQVFCDYSKVLSDSDHEVALLLRDISEFEYENLGVSKIFKLKSLSQISDIFYFIWILFTFRPDIILSHNNRISKWMRIVKIFSKIIGFKSIGINHGVGIKGSLSCDYTLSVGKEIRQMVLDKGFDPNKSFILPNAIKISQKYQKKTISNPITLGFYSRMDMSKGFDILLKAAILIRKYNFKIKIGGFEVANSGYGLKDIKNLAKNLKIADKCQFVGVVKNKKEFFQDVDIFCVPSFAESFGLVILEGFLHSTLVISSKTDGGKLLINDGEDGLLFEIGDYEDLAKKINFILQNQDQYQKLTKNAFAKLEKEFSFNSLSASLEKILQQI